MVTEWAPILSFTESDVESNCDYTFYHHNVDVGRNQAMYKSEGIRSSPMPPNNINSITLPNVRITSSRVHSKLIFGFR